MAGPIRIGVDADTARAQSKLERLGSTSRDLGRKVAGGALVAAGGAAVLGVKAVKAASDSQQSLGATQAVFGKYADTVIRRSNDAATAIGLSANEYRELSNVTGAMLSSTGTPLREVANLTDRLNTRAADMAATFGGTTREAVESIGSLLRGETDPIEKYGVAIKASDVTARLAAKGLDGLTGSALKQAEQQARLELLFSQTNRTAGQFASESGTLAGQQQRLSAQVSNLGSQLGTYLLPIITRIVGGVSAAIPAVSRWAATLGQRLAPAAAAVRSAVLALIDRLAPLTTFFRDNPALIRGAAIALGVAAVAAAAFALAMGAVALATSPITLVVVGVAALGAAIGLAYQRSEAFRSVVATVGGVLATFGRFVVGTVVPAVVALAQRVGTQLAPIVESAGRVFSTKIVPAVQRAVARFRELQPTLSRAAAVVGRVIAVVVTFAARVAGKVIPAVFKLQGFFISRLIPAVVGTIGVIARIIVAVGAFGSKVIGAVQFVARFVSGLKSRFGDALAYVRTIPGRVKDGLGAIGSLLLQSGRDLIAGLVNGIQDAAASAVDAAKDVVGNAIKGAKNLLGIASPSKVFKAIGYNTIRGLVIGLRGGRSAVQSVIRSVTKAIPDNARRSIEPLFKRLRGLADRQDSLNKRFERATTRLKELRKAATEYAAAAAAGVRANGALSSLGEGAGFADAAGLNAIRAGRVAETAEFVNLIKSLRTQGLNKADLNDLIQAGVSGGLGTARALAAGGQAAIRRTNQIAQQLAALGKELGATGRKAMYGAGIDAAEGLVRGLRARQRALDTIGRRLAQSLVSAVRKALKINSPSRVFAEIGTQTTAGLTVGLSASRVARDGVRLAEALTSGFGRPALDTYVNTPGGAAQAGGPVATVRVVLSADKVSRLRNGGEITADVDFYRGRGGRPKVVPAG